MSVAPDIEIVDGKAELVSYESRSTMTLFGTHDPDEVVREASKHAKALAKVVEKQRLFTQIGPNKHIRVEGWQLLGSMTGVFAVGEGEPEPVVLGDVAGFKATVVAMRNGEIIGRATAYCMRDEDRWRVQPTHAIASMAQTRATSKALKGPLGFIVKLAGYESTPAEEMPVERPMSAGTVSERSPFDPPAGAADGKATAKQIKYLDGLIQELTKGGILDAVSLAEGMQQAYGTSLPAELSTDQASNLIERLKVKKEQAE